MNDLTTNYKFGNCYALAMALNRRFGLEIGLLVVNLSERTGPGRHIVHAYCIAEDGQHFDAGGSLTEADIADTYLQPHNKWRYTEAWHERCPDEAALMEKLTEFASECGRGDEFQSFRPYLVRQVDKAVDDIDLLEELQPFLPAAALSPTP